MSYGPARISKASLKEQGYADAKGAVDLDEEKINAELNHLNDEYEKKFGFKFVVFVNGRARKELIPVIKQRMNNSRDEEMKTGIQAMCDIAKDRLKKLTL